MNAPFTGGCACGEVRYEVSGEPAAELQCQCRQCQRQTGTGHSTYLTFAGAAVTLQGEAATWRLVGDLGTVKHAAFCLSCGSPLYLLFPASPDMFAVLAGSLDEPERYAPSMVFWTAAGCSWDFIAPGLARFDRLPPMEAAGA